jgi:hypothetical protein
MAKAKTEDDTRTQREKFMDTAREHGADTDAAAKGFRQFVRAVAKAPVGKPKRAAKPRKGA